jgi:hypothetical protein
MAKKKEQGDLVEALLGNMQPSPAPLVDIGVNLVDECFDKVRPMP